MFMNCRWSYVSRGSRNHHSNSLKVVGTNVDIVAVMSRSMSVHVHVYA